MRGRISLTICALLVGAGMGISSFVYAQGRHMEIHEPHMSAAYGHLEQAKAELDKAAPNKGGHRERAMQAVDQAMQQIEQGEEYYQQHQGR